jgi:hypothetical protein
LEEVPKKISQPTACFSNTGSYTAVKGQFFMILPFQTREDVETQENTEAYKIQVWRRNSKEDEYGETTLKHVCPVFLDENVHFKILGIYYIASMIRGVK